MFESIGVNEIDSKHAPGTDSKKIDGTREVYIGGRLHGFEEEEGFEAMDSKEMDSKEVGSKHRFELGRAHGTLNLNRSYLTNR